MNINEIKKHKEDIEKALADGITRGIAWSMGFIGGKSHDMPPVQVEQMICEQSAGRN